MKAILLSAGLGNRLRPITDFMPKPLLPVVYRPIIEINLSRLIKLGIEKIGINLFYKPTMIKKFLNKFSDFIYIAIENKLKGTGGALLNFQNLVKEDFIIHNCDIVTDINLTEAIKFHKLHKSIATLILTKSSGSNFVKINKDFRVKKFSEKVNEDFYTFTGIAILSDGIFSYLPDTEHFSIIEVYQKIIDSSKLIFGIPTEGTWCDIGTPKRYWQVHHDILCKEVELEGVKVDSQHYIDPSSNVQSENLSGFISIGSNCFISDRVTLNNTIVFNNSRILEGNFSNCLLSDKFCVKIKSNEVF